MALGFRPIAFLAARAADQKKGDGILLLDVKKMTGLTDYVLLINVLSPAHLESIEQTIDELMKTTGVRLLHWEGSDSALWRVLDYGGLIVHLMHETAREFYQLDKLYHNAPRLKWQNESKPAARARHHVA
jgi:ribosome-associated protein